MGKITNIARYWSISDAFGVKYTSKYRHFPNLLECTQNNNLKLRWGIKAIEIEQFTCSENKFGSVY